MTNFAYNITQFLVAVFAVMTILIAIIALIKVGANWLMQDKRDDDAIQKP